MVKYLIEKCKIDSNIQNGDKALESAIFEVNLELVKYLIETCKVDPNI